MNQDQLISLFYKRLSEEIGQDDTQLIEKEFQKTPDSKKHFEYIKMRWEASGKLRPNIKKALTWEEIEYHVIHNTTPQAKQVKFISKWYYAAASVTILLGLFFLFRFYPQPKVITHEAVSSAITVTLPDSSKVWLNKGSALSYSEEFNEDLRDVQLKGEGYFEVEKKPNKPFNVTIDWAQVQVLGTSFNIKEYTTQQTEVTVLTGKVAFTSIDNRNNSIQLLPGDKGIFNKETKSLKKEKNNNQNLLSWKDQKLVFRGAQLSEIVHELESYFDQQFVIDSEALLECQFTMEFEKPSLNEVLEVLSISADIKYQIINGTYQLSGPGCN